jgi:hypothetical protein
MNPREKVLAIIVGSLAGLTILALGARAVIVLPLRNADKKILGVRQKIAKVQEERRAFFVAEDKVKSYARKAFSDSADEASAASGELITKQIIHCGLKESDFTRLPVGARKLRGATELGWNVQGQGVLSNVVNLVYVLNQIPYLHKIEGFSVSPGDAPGLVRVHFRYVTLAVDPAPEVVRKPIPTDVPFGSAEALALSPIVTRDLLRPYIKRPPPDKKAIAGHSKPGASVAAGGPESLRVVSLSEWEGQPEVHVRDIVNAKTMRYKPGDAFGGGTIVTVDYRPVPMPGKEPLQSYSRVILRIGKDYWAIERGNTLAEKRKLAAADLPAGLSLPQ